MKKLFFAAAMALPLLVSCCNTPAPGTGILPREKAENIEADTEKFDQVFFDVYSHCTEELHSMMILQDGKVIYEQYATGHNAQEIHALWSATKTFTATAVGFAQQDGLLDVHDPILKYFREDEIPAEHSEWLDKVTIHDLLTMSSGIGDGDYNFEVEADGTVNCVKHCLACPMEAEPGTRFSYNNNDTHLCGVIVARVTGKTLEEYLNEKLFSHLGIVNYRWFTSPDGYNIGSYGLYLTLEELATMGQFMLQKGEWEGKRLLNSEWFDTAMSEQIYQGIADKSQAPEQIARSHAENDWGAGYGYQMWMMSGGRGARLDGANGQFCIILPQKNAVVAMFSKCWNTSIEMTSLWNNVYPQL